MTSIDLGPLVLGGNVFGWTADRAASFRILDAFVDAGGVSIDTADVYSAWVDGHSGGESETIIGEWLDLRPSVRDRVTIATKVFAHPQRPGLDPANIAFALDDSLRRLRTDRIDLYYAHRDDESVPQAAYLAAFDEAVRLGKIRAVGLSNFTGERIRSAVAVAVEAGLTVPGYSQDRYSLVERGIEADLIPAIVESGLVEVPYSSLASGFLSGKYRPGVDVSSARAGTASAYLDDERNITLLGVLDEVAAAHTVSVTAVSLAWLRSRPGVQAALASARNEEQLVDLVASFGLELEADELASLTAASDR